MMTSYENSAQRKWQNRPLYTKKYVSFCWILRKKKVFVGVWTDKMLIHRTSVFWNVDNELRVFLYGSNNCLVILGRALLFKRVVNLTYTHIQDRVMLTGRHMVRFIILSTKILNSQINML